MLVRMRIQFIAIALLPGSGAHAAERWPTEAWPTATPASVGLDARPLKALDQRTSRPQAGNVMLTKTGAVKLVDFGLAKNIGAATTPTRHPSPPDKPLTEVMAPDPTTAGPKRAKMALHGVCAQ